MLKIEIIIYLTLICLSFWIFIQKFGNLARKFNFKEEHVTKIVVVVAIFSLTFVFSGKNFLFKVILVSGFLTTSPFFAEIFFQRRSQGIIAKQRISLLNSVILGLCTGKSIRDTIKDELLNLHPEFAAALNRELLESVAANTKENSPQSRDIFVLWMLEAEKNPFSARSLLEGVRRRIQIREKLYQKSKQVLSQIDAQVVVMSILYLILLGFLCFNYAMVELWRFVAWSLTLFILGAFISFNIKRGFKWKL